MADDELVDPLAALIAEIDQWARNASHIARAQKAHFDALIEAGFTEAQALHLTGAFWKSSGGSD